MGGRGGRARKWGRGETCVCPSPPPPPPPPPPAAAQILETEAYKRGDLATAITEAYYALDVMMDKDEGKAELRQLAGAPKDKCARAVWGGGGGGAVSARAGGAQC